MTRSVPRIAVRRENTVFLVQDMQRFLTDPNAGIGAIAADRGVSTEFDEYYEQVSIVTANIIRLRDFLSSLGIPTWYTRWISEPSGSKTALNTALDIVPEDGEQAAEIIESISPAHHRNVFEKPAFSAFSSSTLSSTLCECRIENIVLCGVMTEIGIQATALQAMELGYRPMIVGDCCAAMTFATNELALDGLSFGVAKIRPWQELCYGLEELCRDDVALI